MYKLNTILSEIKTYPKVNLVVGDTYLYDNTKDETYPETGIKHLEVKYEGRNSKGIHIFTWGLEGMPGGKRHYLGFNDQELNKNLKSGVLSKLQKETKGKKFKTTQTGHDPETRMTSWDVTYEPDFDSLIKSTSRLLRDYRATLKKNNLENNAPLLRNIQHLEDFRTNLVYLSQNLDTKLTEILFEIKVTGAPRKLTFQEVKELVKLHERDIHDEPGDPIYDDIDRCKHLNELISVLDAAGHEPKDEILFAIIKDGK